MSVPQLLREGYMNEDWAKVAEAYTLLTGTNIVASGVGKKKRGRPKKGGVVEQSVNTVATVLNPGKPANKFVDDGTMHKADKIIDKKLWAGVKQVDRRPEVKKFKVHCKKCSQPCEIFESELPVVIEGSPLAAYVCNSCQGKR